MPKLFLTYAWIDNEDGNLDFVAQELRAAGVEVVYDRVALRPGRRLWEQIGDRISSGDIDGWAFLVTPGSLRSQACLEEYYLALGRALDSRGDAFPLIALVYGAAFKDLPPSLRIRLGISLSDAGWSGAVRAALEGTIPLNPATSVSSFSLKWHPVPGSTEEAWLEVRPRLAPLGNWRVAFASESKAVDSKPRLLGTMGFCESGSGAGPGACALTMPISAPSVIHGQWVVGARGPIGGGLSAYVRLRRPFPASILVGSEGGPVEEVPVPPG